MIGTTTLIVGGGWGGLTAAHHLRSLLAAEHRVVVVEPNDTFGLGVSNLWLMTGERDGLGEVRRPMRNLKRSGIEWVHSDARDLDLSAHAVDTDAGRLDGDYLVLAVGAELAPDAVPGFSEAAYNLYEAEAALALHEALDTFEGGSIVVLVAGAPFRCPAAPYEAAMLIEAMARGKGIRGDVELSLYTPEPAPMLVAGPAVGEALEAMLGDRDISYHPKRTVTRIDPASGAIEFDDERVPCDLLVGIPPHRAPTLMADAGLIDGSGYVPVHPQTLEILSDPDTLELQYPGVFAIGDVAAVRLLNAMLLPKAGVFAEAQAQVVASAIAADIQGQPRPRGYDGHGFCYVEVGDGLAASGTGDFYAYPGPRVTLESPTAASKTAKQEYEQLLSNWFED